MIPERVMDEVLELRAVAHDKRQWDELVARLGGWEGADPRTKRKRFGVKKRFYVCIVRFDDGETRVTIVPAEVKKNGLVDLYENRIINLLMRPDGIRMVDERDSSDMSRVAKARLGISPGGTNSFIPW